GRMLNATTGEDLWLRRFHRAPAHDFHGPRLVCFPHAGASASSFFSFSRSLADALEVVVVQYPGRQERRMEPSFRDIGELANQISLVLKTLTDRPLAFFGHSMGAIAAFEVARRLEAERGFSPIALFASGRRAPCQYRTECM